MDGIKNILIQLKKYLINFKWQYYIYISGQKENHHIYYLIHINNNEQ